ncbi:MAG: hypothetical protein ACP5O0_03215 [Acidimicrobiales bacterium]
MGIESSCPFCGVSPSGSGGYGIVPNEHGLGFLAGTTEIARATKIEEVIQIRRPSALSSELFALSSTGTDRRVSVLLDRSLNPLAQITFYVNAKRQAVEHCAVELPQKAIALELRTDGPTGLHLVDQNGAVIALGSYRGCTPRDGLDLIIVRPDRDLLPLGYFGIFLIMVDAAASLNENPVNWIGDGHFVQRPSASDLFDFGA